MVNGTLAPEPAKPIPCRHRTGPDRLPGGRLRARGRRDAHPVPVIGWLVARQGDAPMFRTLSLVLAVLALALFCSAATVLAEEKADTHEGTFVKADAKTLTMKGKDDKTHSHDLSADT